MPASRNDVTDLITSYTSFDTTKERNRVDPPAQVTVKPITFRDVQPIVTLSACNPCAKGARRYRRRPPVARRSVRQVEIEIAMCDDEVRAELARRQEQLRQREQEIVRRITQVTADPEFQRAATEVEDNTINLAVKTSELIAATLTGSQTMAVKNGSATVGSLSRLETAQNIWSVSGIITDARNGAIVSAGVGTYAQRQEFRQTGSQGQTGRTRFSDFRSVPACKKPRTATRGDSDSRGQ